jgi:hypothetical protein
MARSIEQVRTAFPYSEDCFQLEKTSGRIINEKSFYSTKMNSAEILVLDKRLKELNDFYSKINCELVLGNKKLEQTLGISEKYQELDKIRIETESFKQRNKRIMIGIAIILAGVGIILITNKK